MHIMTSLLVCYIIGVISFKYDLLVFIIPISLLFFIFKYIRKRNIYYIVLLLVLATAIVNSNYNSKSILKQYIGKEIRVNAVVKNKRKSKNNDFNSFDVEIIKINNKKLLCKEKTIIFVKKEVECKENCIIDTIIDVNKVKSENNRLVFNYRDYLSHKNVHAICFANGKINIIERDVSYITKTNLRFKNYTKKLFYSKMDFENANIILSILLGDSSLLQDEFLGNVRQIGLAHVFAVSGLHVGLLYIFFFKLLNKLNLGKLYSYLISWLILWLYGFLIGFPISVLRALLMFTIHFGADITYRKYNSTSSISLAALILLLINPFSVFDVGFQLSFTATLGLILCNKFKRRGAVIDNITRIIFLQIFIVPILACHFNYIPILGIVYNIFLIPIFTVIIIMSFILIFIGWINCWLINMTFNLFNYYLVTTTYIIKMLGVLTINGLRIYTLKLGSIVIYYIFISLLVNIEKVNKYRYKYIIMTFMYIIFLFNNIIIPFTDTNLYINIIDVGQGLSSVVTYKNNNYVIDSGSNSNKKIGKNVLVPYMLKRGIFDIEAIFISHWHYDHYSGLNDLLSNFTIDELYSGYINKDIEVNKDINIISKGTEIVIDNNFNMEILWPNSDYIDNNENNMSQVILVSYNDNNIMFTGDIEKEVECKLVEKNKNFDVDILIVPHHGSKTSSTKEFVDIVNPQIAVMSYGKNSYGIPSNEVIKRYNDNGVKLLSTFEDGEINFTISKKDIFYRTYNDNFLNMRISVQTIIINVIILLLAIYCSYFLRKDEEFMNELYKSSKRYY